MSHPNTCSNCHSWRPHQTQAALPEFGKCSYEGKDAHVDWSGPGFWCANHSVHRIDGLLEVGDVYYSSYFGPMSVVRDERMGVQDVGLVVERDTSLRRTRILWLPNADMKTSRVEEVEWTYTDTKLRYLGKLNDVLGVEHMDLAWFNGLKKHELDRSEEPAQV